MIKATKLFLLYSILAILFFLIILFAILLLVRDKYTQERSKQQYAKIETIQAMMVGEFSEAINNLRYYSHGKLAKDTLEKIDVN